MKKIWGWMLAAWFWLVVFIMTILSYLVVVMTIPIDVLTGRSDGRRPHAVAGVWGRTIFRLMPMWKVRVTGQENLSVLESGRWVIVANHESMADIWVMYFLGVQFRWLSKASVFKIPLVGHAMRRAGYVPIVRGQRNSHEIAMKESAKRLAQGIPMFFFPEGTRSATGELRPFKIGAFKLARDNGARILPIALHGAGDLLRKGSAVPCPAKISVAVLEPIDDNPAESLDAFAARVRSTIAEAHAKLKASDFEGPQG
jgi:1-acyl-sn-glycerol-3-phosphate acyltransferase